MNQLIKQEIQKSNIPEVVAAIATAVESGETNALKALTLLKIYETIVTAARKEIMQQALKERAKYGKGECAMLGFKITEMESGTSYDYSGCGDIEWERWDAAVLSATNSRKAREAVLKALKDPMTLVNEDTGETYRVNPPLKKSTTTLKFT